MSSPLLSLGNWASPSVMLVLRDGRMTASVSSSASSKDPADFTAPASVTNSPSICSGQVHADRCGGTDRVFEGRGGAATSVAALACIQEEHGAVPPALLLAAHHELSITRRGTPVHAA